MSNNNLIREAAEGIQAFLPDFKKSMVGSMGIELELMILDRLSYDLFPAAPDLLKSLEKQEKKWTCTPEITTSMLEIATSILNNYQETFEQLEQVRIAVNNAASQSGAFISGGGAHPFQKWSEQRIFPKQRYLNNSSKFGYLSKLFTVFGMHVHIGVDKGDEAIRLCHNLTQLAPIFLALSAASPYWQGEDSFFASSRSNVVGAFPMSGTIPDEIKNWQGFKNYFDELAKLEIVKSIKDFYWDVRPKPEYGTVEVRILDTPLHTEIAGAMAAYIREKSLELIAEKDYFLPSNSIIYKWNRFNAAKMGIEAEYINPVNRQKFIIKDYLKEDLRRLKKKNRDINFFKACLIIEKVLAEGGQAEILRKVCKEGKSLNDMSRKASELFLHKF